LRCGGGTAAARGRYASALRVNGKRRSGGPMKRNSEVNATTRAGANTILKKFERLI
jgi:hypothetical protein